MSQSNYWAIVPAAGIGKRAESELPKQYAPLLDKTVIEITIDKLIKSQIFTGIVVVLAEGDSQFANLPIAQHPMISTATGGRNRQDSVLAGLQHIKANAQANDWVFVHDAARPCLTIEDIMLLFKHSVKNINPASLGAPVNDSLKKVDDSFHIQSNVSRDRTWRVFTPQIATFQILIDSLSQAIDSKHYEQITDETSALLLSGHQVSMIEGNTSNIKITTKSDFELASFYLKKG